MARKSKKGTQGQQPAAPPVPAEVPAREMSEVDRLLVGMAAQQETGDEGATEGVAGVAAEPAPNATYWTELDLICKQCRVTHYVPLCLFLNAAESPHLVERIIKGQFNYKRCPVCHTIEYVEHPFTFYDPGRKLAVQVRPEWEWHAGGGDEWYAARLEDFFERWQDHDVRIDVVFGPQQLIDRFLLAGTVGEPAAIEGH